MTKAPRKTGSVDTYDVTLRRDVQQVTSVRVQARSAKEAIANAEAVSDDDAAWNIEEQLGAHKPEVHKVRR